MNGDTQLRTLSLLHSLEWQELHARQAFSLREGRTSEVLLRPVLEERLRAINSFEYRGQQRAFSKEAIDTAIQALQRSTQEELLYSNEKIWSLLRLGTQVRETVGEDTQSFTIHYVDWENPANNTYHVVQDFEVTGSGQPCRPDVVLFVNGIPVVVIEEKSASEGDDTRQLNAAIEQLQSYQRAPNIPRLFHYAQLLIAAGTKRAAYGMVGAERHEWSEWRETAGAPPTIRALVESAAEQPSADASLLGNDRDRLIYSLCRPGRLLDLARWFTFFHAGHRSQARYYQYFAIQAVLERVNKPEIDGRRRGGIVWHTQGTGKSLTMVMLSRVLLDVYRERRPRVVLVTDRAEMDEQFHRNLVANGIDCRQASTSLELRNLLQDRQVRTITTLIQKFGAASNRNALIADSPDIFVLVDEAHRTQSGQLYQAMRWMLPRACFIGFTGTLRPEGDTQTPEAFGSLTATYTFEQAVQDGVLLPILWEDHAAVVGATPVRELVGHSAVDLQNGDDDSPQTFHQFLRELETEERIRNIASDVAAHFTEHFSGTPLKGQLVASSRIAALKFKHCLDALGTVSSEVVLSFEDKEPITEEPEEAGPQALIQMHRQEIVQKFGSGARHEADVIRRFKETGHPQLLIVVDKLLTGFDVPRNAVMYLTRPLKSHALVQAIARVNRSYTGKEHASVVDYAGQYQHLDPATVVTLERPSRGKAVTKRARRIPDEETRIVLPSSSNSEARPPPVLEQSCQQILQEEFDKTPLSLAPEVAQFFGGRIAEVIFWRRKVDWTSDPDVRNRMKTAIEDVLFEMQDQEGVALGYPVIDAILERCVEAGRTIVPG